MRRLLAAVTIACSLASTTAYAGNPVPLTPYSLTLPGGGYKLPPLTPRSRSFEKVPRTSYYYWSKGYRSPFRYNFGRSARSTSSFNYWGNR